MKKKSILIIGNKENFTLEKMYYKSLKHLGHNIDFFKIDITLKNLILAKLIYYIPFFHYASLRKKLINFFKKNKKKYDIIIIFKGLYLNLETIKKIKKIKKNTIWLNIFPDDPFELNNPTISNQSFLNTITEFDIFCIWSKKIKNQLEKLHKNVFFIYLPFAYDNLVKFKTKKKNIFKIDRILFVGTYDQKRKEVLDSIKIQKTIYGGNWKNLIKFNSNRSNIHGHLHGQKLHEAISSYKINLNILRDQNATSHNMRTFEIPGHNGLMLTNRTKEQNNFFRENQECYMYSNIKELNSKIEFIIKNSKKADKVRKRGIFKVKKHNYLNRSKYLLKKINEFIKNKSEI